MLHFWKTSARRGRRIGVLPAAFNPVTNAHLEMARQAAGQHALDEVLFLLPRVFPHKTFTGASFEQRLEMLRAALAGEPGFSIGSTDQGLFIDIARACRPVFGPEAEFFFLCGRDAAERIVNWDYGPDTRFSDLLGEFQMIVLPRGGGYEPPGDLAGRVHPLNVPEIGTSSSAVREAIAAGHEWEHMVPPGIAEIIKREQLYQ